MQLSRYVIEDNRNLISASSAPRRVKRLRNIPQEMRDPFQRIRTRQVGSPAQAPRLHVLNTLLQYPRLVRNSRYNTAPLGAIPSVIQRTRRRRVVMRVDPMPLVRKAAFLGVRVCICPGCGPANGAVILRLEDLLENGRGVGIEELLGHEADLVVDWKISSCWTAPAKDTYHQYPMLLLKLPVYLQAE